MKKFTYLFALVLFSCSIDSTTDKTQEVENSELKQLTAMHNKENNGLLAEYDSNIIAPGMVDNELVLVNTKNGINETFYLLKFEETPPKELQNLEKGSYEIVDLHGELILKHDGKTFYFSTLEKPEYKDVFKGDKTYMVFEISKHHIEDDVRKSVDGVNYFETLKRRAECKCVSIFSYETCDAGGEGTSYCSSSACSVSCRERYFACCQNG
ncbi:MAG TPA: hypothetical protein VFM70_08415 [Salinimicrobium sp.]|nr:hypothetical protein [Salinimicrobium sp.]